MTRPVATIKSARGVSGSRNWKARCFLHPQPLVIGLFGTPATWMTASHVSRKAALAALAIHQRSTHPCTDCTGLACSTCEGTGVDLSQPTTAEVTL